MTPLSQLVRNLISWLDHSEGSASLCADRVARRLAAGLRRPPGLGGRPRWTTRWRRRGAARSRGLEGRARRAPADAGPEPGMDADVDGAGVPAERVVTGEPSDTGASSHCELAGSLAASTYRHVREAGSNSCRS